MTIKNITQLKKLNRQNGMYFFSKNTMRFFESVVESKLYIKDHFTGYFVTSEKSGNGNIPERAFKVRKANLESGNVIMAEDTTKYKRFQSAMFALKGILEEVQP